MIAALIGKFWNVTKFAQHEKDLFIQTQKIYKLHTETVFHNFYSHQRLTLISISWYLINHENNMYN